jgi:hypothetical protein
VIAQRNKLDRTSFSAWLNDAVPVRADDPRVQRLAALFRLPLTSCLVVRRSINARWGRRAA